MAKQKKSLILLITQVLFARKIVFGANPNQLFCKIPYKDFMSATIDALQHLTQELTSDTRNVLLTLARIWSTVEIDAIRSKPAIISLNLPGLLSMILK